MSRPPLGTKASRSTVNQFHYINFIHNHTGAYLYQSATDYSIHGREGVIEGSLSPTEGQLERGPLALLASKTTPQAYHNSERRQSIPHHGLSTCRTWQPIRDAIHLLLTRPIDSNDPPVSSTSILLLTGHAKGGKSIFLQTVADTYHATDQLQAGHFYESVPDIAQRTAGALLANIAYRCYLSQADSLGVDILETIARHPVIFELSLDERFRQLIANPINRRDHERKTPSKASLIVIDGIDRCRREEKEQILILIRLFVTTFKNRFVFLISTRIDPELQYSIAKLGLLPSTTELALDNLNDQSRDISAYLKQRFAACRQYHPYQQHIPPLWPNKSDIEGIVDKCSGNFWLAEIAANYIIDFGADPLRRLVTFMEYLDGRRWDTSSQDYPFRDMDNLFKSILEPLTVESRSVVLDVLSFHMLYKLWSRSAGPPVQAIIDIFELEPGEAAVQLANVSSIVNESGRVSGQRCLAFPHVTLQDFLFHRGRACELYIDWETRVPIHIAQCLKSLMRAPSMPPHVLETAMRFFYANQHLITDVRNDILGHVVSLSIPHINLLIKSSGDDIEQGKLLNNFILYFLPSFVVFLNRFKHARRNLRRSEYQSNYSYQFRRHLKDHFDLLLSVAAAVYASDQRLSFNLALAFVSKKPAWPAFNMQLEDHQHLTLLLTYFTIIPSAQRYQHSLAFFSSSAFLCLVYLGNQATTTKGIRAPASTIFRVPWSLRKQGSNAEFMWFRQHFPDMYRVTSPRLRDSLRRSIASPFRQNGSSPSAQTMVPASTRSVHKALARRRQALRSVHSREHQIALFCLIRFLPRAGKSSQLLRLCATPTFSSGPPICTNLSRKAQEAMSAYVARWKDYISLDT